MEEIVRQIPNPMNYFNGFGKVHMPLPKDILLYHRSEFSDKGIGPYTYSHSRYECIINLGDPMTVNLDGIIRVLPSDEGMLIFPFQYHRYISAGGSKVLALFITFIMDETSFFDEMHGLPFPIKEKTRLLLHLICSTYLLHQEDDSLPFYIGLFLYNCCSTQKNVNTMINTKGSRNKLLEEITHEIITNKIFTVKELSSKLRLSEGYLRLFFKKMMQITLGTYIIEVRMNMATRLLLETDESISNIADECRYDSIFSFSRAFKTYIHIAPKDYRQFVRNTQSNFSPFLIKRKETDK